MEATRMQGPSSPPPQGGQVARTRPGAASAAGPDAAAAQGGGAFLSLLAALEPLDGAALTTAQDAALPATGSTPPADEPAAQDAAQAMLQAGWWTQPEVPVLPNAVQDAVGGSVLESRGGLHSGLLPTHGPGALPVPGGPAVGGKGLDSMLLAAGLPDGLVAQTARLDAAAGDGRQAGAGLVGDAEGAPARPGGAGRKAGASRGAAALGAMDATAASRPTLARYAPAGDAVSAPGSLGAQATPSQAQSLQAAAAGLGRAALEAERQAGGAAPQSTLSAAVAEAGAVRAPAPRHEPGGGAFQSGTDGAWAAPAADGFSAPMADLPADAGVAAFEEALADEVAFWVNQNLQKAELTVSHDGMPVDVSVALQGNQAHVSFTAEQASTRELLDASQAQLRDLLQQHGLELAGLSIGQNAQQPGAGPGGEGSGRGQDDPRGGAGVQAGPAAVDGVRTGIRVLTDRAVDLFV
ncbi:flagellar hook-length control protein FliK [Comamonas granuli]|uniref:flagellar hook-length control protein FliK n=1 Tax=Comamonas granuli TaxID=290309 RepID=UPI0012EC653D|nr:flagellar hook-length control protein FliK [Comamonas granuli]